MSKARHPAGTRSGGQFRQASRPEQTVADLVELVPATGDEGSTFIDSLCCATDRHSWELVQRGWGLNDQWRCRRCGTPVETPPHTRPPESRSV